MVLIVKLTSATEDLGDVGLGCPQSSRQLRPGDTGALHRNADILREAEDRVLFPELGSLLGFVEHSRESILAHTRPWLMHQ